MPHYSATVNSFEEIRSEIINACVLHGWTQSGNAVTKGALAAEFTVVAREDSGSTNGEGLHIEGGTGYSGGLLEPSPTAPRMGPPAYDSSLPQWPMDLDIHIFTNPDEVYAVAKFSVDYHMWLAFGQSSIALPGTGMWIAANAVEADGPPVDGVYITPSGGAGGSTDRSTTGIFWRDYGYYSDRQEHSVHVDLPDVPGWLAADSNSNANGHGAISETHNLLIQRSPNSWNSEAVLIPIQLFIRRSEDMRSLAVDLQNARTLRIDNYDPGQIITLGTDQWRVYPFYRKNSDVRDGTPSNGGDHSGTMGWAIRYDPEP